MEDDFDEDCHESIDVVIERGRGCSRNPSRISYSEQ